MGKGGSSLEQARLVLRLDAEMNGAWYDYGSQAGQNPQAFVAMWRHVHDLFVAAGATNVSWQWCPNVDPESVQTPLEQLYPGDAYVDWTGMTGYNEGGESVSWLFDSTYFATPYVGAVEADNDRRDGLGRFGFLRPEGAVHE